MRFLLPNKLIISLVYFFLMSFVLHILQFLLDNSESLCLSFLFRHSSVVSLLTRGYFTHDYFCFTQTWPLIAFIQWLLTANLSGAFFKLVLFPDDHHFKRGTSFPSNHDTISGNTTLQCSFYGKIFEWKVFVMSTLSNWVQPEDRILQHKYFARQCFCPAHII